MQRDGSLAERRLNCWEFNACGLGPDDMHSKNGSACLASAEKRTDGVNSGKNGGRACWAIAGTECGGRPECGFARKIDSCQSCLFYLIVMEEEHPVFTSTERILPMLH